MSAKPRRHQLEYQNMSASQAQRGERTILRKERLASLQLKLGAQVHHTYTSIQKEPGGPHHSHQVWKPPARIYQHMSASWTPRGARTVLRQKPRNHQLEYQQMSASRARGERTVLREERLASLRLKLGAQAHHTYKSVQNCPRAERSEASDTYSDKNELQVCGSSLEHRCTTRIRV